MNSSWGREGDFYQYREGDFYHGEVKHTGTGVTNIVSFRNYSRDAIVREIEISSLSKKGFWVCLKISPTVPHFQECPFRIIETYFPVRSSSSIYEERTIYEKYIYISSEVYSESGLNESIDTFKKINHDLQQEVFPQVIFNELNRIHAFASGAALPGVAHIVPNHPYVAKSTANINPKKKTSTALVTYLWQVRKKEKKLWLSTLKEFLSEGEDPNQLSHQGTTPILLCDDLDGILLLRGYGANTHEPVSNRFFYSAMEQAIGDNIPNKPTYLTMGALPKQLSPKLPENLPKIIKTEESYIQSEDKPAGNNQGCTITTFHYSDGQTITVHFKNTEALTEDEVRALFPIYKHSFEYVSDEYKPANIEDEFKKDFAPSENVFAESIYHQGPNDKEKQLVAFNHYVLSYCLGRVMAYCGYSAIARDSKFSGAGLMSLLAFRLAFSLKVMVGPDVDVIRSHLAIHFKSMTMFKMILEECIYPKYKTPFLNLLSQFFFAQMYKPGDAKYVSNRTTLCAVEETHPLKVVGSNPPIKVAEDAKAEKPFDLFELLFEQHFRIFSERLAPMIFCYIALENYIKLCQLGERLGINTNENLVDYAEAVHPLVKGFLGQKTFKRIAPKDVPKLFEPISSLFWRVRVPSLPLTTVTAGLPPPSQKPSSL